MVEVWLPPPDEPFAEELRAPADDCVVVVEADREVGLSADDVGEAACEEI